jgi:hypothetical protein
VSGIFGFSLQLILGSVNALQMISHLTMINVLLTDNTIFLYSLIQTVVGFDLWSPFDYYDFGFTETLPWFDRFDWCGYGSQNFYENIGSVALF